MVYRKVKIIEDMPLQLNKLIELLLIYSKQKPATVYHHYMDDLFAIFYRGFENYLKRITRSLEKINVCYHVGELQTIEFKSNSDYYSPIESNKPIYIAKDESWLERIIAADNEKDGYELGRCFGFPETAIQAFHGDRSPFMGHFHDGNPLGYFTQFVFSEEYFEEELETSKKWHDTVKNLSSKLYEEAANVEIYFKEYNLKSFIEWR